MKSVQLVAAGAALLLLAGCSATAVEADASGEAGEPIKLTIAEPVHGVGYLPLYAAQEQGFFEDAGLEVEVTTLTGGGHVNALLAGEVFGFIGGPESGAVANVKGADLVAVANVVNRGNVYFVAADGYEYEEGTDVAEFLRGKTIAGGRYGGTPNAILRHILLENGLDPETDVELIEVEDSSAIPSIVAQGQAEIAVVAEPQLGMGIAEGIWGEPFLNPLQLLGPYAYSSIVIQRSMLDEDPETVQKFVDALALGQDFIENDPDAAFELASVQFPTMDAAVLETVLARAYEDSLWGGTELSEEAVETALAVARSGNILDDAEAPQDYSTIADNQFINAD